MQPKKTKLDDNVQVCPSCGLPVARLVRMDNYLSLFFVPLFPVKKGDVVLECSRCGAISHPDGQGEPLCRGDRCPGCGGGVNPGFSFCPHCGARLD